MPDRDPRALLVLMLDRSASMAGPSADGVRSRSEIVCSAVNDALRFLADQAEASGVADRIDLALLGVATDRLARPAVASLINAPGIVPLSVVATSPLRTEARTREVPDDLTGEIVEETILVPIWVEPASSGGTPLCAAFHEARDLVESWTRINPSSPPAVVVLLTDGLSRDGHPGADASSITSSSGAPLLALAHLADEARGSPLVYPSHIDSGACPLATLFFDLVSSLPDDLLSWSGEVFDRPLPRGSRFLVFNADFAIIADFLDFIVRLILHELG